MAKMTDKLTAVGIKALKASGRYSDGGNLFVVVSKAGSKTWAFIFKFHGRQREAGFGNVDSVSLKAARARAREGRELLAEGKDPLEHWRTAKRTISVPTFAEAIETYLEARSSKWRSAKHFGSSRTMLMTHAKTLMKLPVNEIAAGDVAAVMKTLVKAGKVQTAARLRGHIEGVLSPMIVLGYIPGLNPARWKDNIEHLAPGEAEREHFAAMDYERVPDFVRDLRAQRERNGAIYVPAYTLEFCILTATRAGEALGCRWEEVDRDAKLWRLPKGRMKAGKTFEAPLSEPAMEIIEAMAAIKVEGCPFVFPGYSRLTAIAGVSLARLLRRMGETCTVHGFRSSFRDWAGNETPTPRDVCEMALAHKVGDLTERSYRRQDGLAKRRQLMDLWGAYCGSSPFGAADNVVQCRPDLSVKLGAAVGATE
jgi:integrase